MNFITSTFFSFKEVFELANLSSGLRQGRVNRWPRHCQGPSEERRTGGHPQRATLNPNFRTKNASSRIKLINNAKETISHERYLV
jgi:hypothetical protein